MTGLLAATVQFAVVSVRALHIGQVDQPVDPTDVADRVEQIMADPAYEYGPSWWDRLVEWIEEQLAKLFPQGDLQEPTSSGSFGGGIGQLVAWALIAVAVIALIAVVVYVLRNRIRRERTEDRPPTETEIEHRRSAAEWRTDAEQLEDDGQWKLALRARYRELVRTLTDRRQLPDVAGRTTGELRGDLDATTPAAAADFDAASVLFELAWYADVPTGPDERDTFAAAARSVLDAPSAPSSATRGADIEVLEVTR